MKTTEFALVGVLAVALTGCAAQSADSAPDGIRIVASTDVYGDIAQTIAGDRADVTSIITSVAQDPHSYEATARDQLAVVNADVVIENGGGYDVFMDDLLQASDATVLTVSGFAEDAPDMSAHGEEGHSHSGEFNEHVWYDLHVIDAFSAALAAQLAEVDPAGAADYRANLADFAERLDGLIDRVDSVSERFTGDGSFATEPVPGYLLAELGFVDETPAPFVAAVEGGIDVAPAVLLDALRALESGSVSLVVHNEQTSGSEIRRVVQAARDAGIPVVAMTETLPDGADYVGWMDSNVTAVLEAMGADQ